MRTAQQRDEQTITIFTAVLLFAAVVGGGMLLAVLAEWIFGWGPGPDALLVLTAVGVVLAVQHLTRRRG